MTEKLVFTLKETTKYWFGSIENTKLEIINKNEQEQSRMEKIETDCKEKRIIWNKSLKQ